MKSVRRFREDVYWRLNVVPIEISAENGEKTSLSLTFFLNHYKAYDRYVVHISRDVLDAYNNITGRAMYGSYKTMSRGPWLWRPGMVTMTLLSPSVLGRES